MKYIDADKLRAEIDRLYGEYKAKFHQNGDSYHLGIIDGLDMAERILDTIPEEPVSEDLEDELDRFIASGESVTVDDYGTYKVSYHDFKKVARHFAEWQKAKMVEGAVEGVIFQPEDYYPKELIAHYNGELKHGDKVKIIIVKED